MYHERLIPSILGRFKSDVVLSQGLWRRLVTNIPIFLLEALSYQILHLLGMTNVTGT